METGEGPPLTNSQRREQAVHRRDLVMYKLDEYAKVGKEPFGKAEYAIGYIKGAVEGNDNKEVGKYLREKGIEIEITNNISVRVGDPYTYSSYGINKEGYTLIVKVRNKDGGERSVYIKGDLKKGINELHTASYELGGGRGEEEDFKKLNKLRPRKVINKIKERIEFNAEPRLSSVKKAGKTAATVVLAGGVLAGGIYKGPEIASDIKDFVNKVDSAHVQTTDQSIKERYSDITPTPTEASGKENRIAPPIPQPPATSAEGSTVEKKELNVYREVYHTIIKDGIDKSYYFTGSGSYYPQNKDGTIGAIFPPPGKPIFLLPEIGGPDRDSTMVVVSSYGRPITLTLSREDAQRLSSLMKKEIENFERVTLKGSDEAGTAAHWRDFSDVGSNYPLLNALIGSSKRTSIKESGEWIFRIGDLKDSFKSISSRFTQPDELVQALGHARDSFIPHPYSPKDHDASTKLFNQVERLLAESSQVNQKK